MKKRSRSRQAVVASIALMVGVLASSAALAQMDHGPKTEKIYGIGLPRHHASQLFSDKDYPVFPLKPGQEAYKDIRRRPHEKGRHRSVPDRAALPRHRQQAVVVAFQLERHRTVYPRRKTMHITKIGSPKTIDRLGVITDTVERDMITERCDEIPLKWVGILHFVNKNMVVEAHYPSAGFWRRL